MSGCNSYHTTLSLWEQVLSEHDIKTGEVHNYSMDTRIRLGNEYLALILKLPTKDLELLLEEYYNKTVCRARKTILAVEDEIAERIFLGKDYE